MTIEYRMTLDIYDISTLRRFLTALLESGELEKYNDAEAMINELKEWVGECDNALS